MSVFAMRSGHVICYPLAQNKRKTVKLLTFRKRSVNHLSACDNFATPATRTHERR